MIDVQNVSLTVICDNYPFKDGLDTQWGFACLIKVPGKNILLDVGESEKNLLENMKKLSIDPTAIDIVMLSHDHYDHTDGLPAFLNKNSDVDVCVLTSFSDKTKDMIKQNGARLIEVQDFSQIHNGVYSTGEMGDKIKEHTLIIKTNKGLVIITGCAHPGVVEIVQKAQELCGDDVLFVMGGFHLYETSKDEIVQIVSKLKELGVHFVAPCHCSGDQALSLFEQEFGQQYVSVGAGKTFNLSDFS